MTFEYLQRVTVEAQIEVDNIGETCLLARNDLGEEWYLMIHTELGWTEVIEYGPAVPDISLLPASVHYSYDRFEFSDFKITRRIENFLNAPKRGITQATIAELEDIEKNIPNFIHKVYSYRSCEDDEDE